MLSSVKVAARNSPLSRAQVEEVERELQIHHPGISFDPLWVETSGDKDLLVSLRTLDKSDFFTREIDTLQLQGACRIAIHSAKDLPEPLCPGLKCVALTRGLDSSDVLILRKEERLEHLPKEARIGTSSERREVAIRTLFPTFQCVDIRGTIQQRLALLGARHIDGLVVAKAALIRLRLQLNEIGLPGKTAPMQGRLAVIARADDREMEQLFASLNPTILYLGLDPKHFHEPCHLIHYPVIAPVVRSVEAKIFATLDSITHILFTSQQAVHFFFSHLAASGKRMGKQTLVAIGKVTALALEEQGQKADWISPVETQEGLVQLLETKSLEGAYFLLPRSSRARSILIDFFENKRVRYLAFDLYDTLIKQNGSPPDLTQIDEIIFTSPSTVEGFIKIFGQLPKTKILRAIGPITQAALDLYLNSRLFG